MEIPRHWRLRKQRYGLVGEVCNHCDYKIFPPRDVCPNCGENKCQRQHQFSGKGEVYSFTTDQGGKVVAIIKLDEGPMVTAQITDLHGEVKINMPVEMVTRKYRVDGKDEDTGMIIYGYKFRPTSLTKELSTFAK